MRSIFSISIIVIGSLLAGTAAAEQTGAGTLSGRIVDASLGGPLPGAVVLVEGTVLQGASDEEGRFLLAGVPAGDQTAVVRFLGSQTVRAPVTVLAGQTVMLDIELRDAFVLEETVTVTAGPIGDGAVRALNQQKTAPNITNVVSADQIGQFPDANAAEATQRIPGISIERDQGEGRYVVIRGSEARLNSMLINGERIPSPEGDVRQVALDVVPTDPARSHPRLQGAYAGHGRRRDRRRGEPRHEGRAIASARAGNDFRRVQRHPGRLGSGPLQRHRRAAVQRRQTRPHCHRQLQRRQPRVGKYRAGVRRRRPR